MLRFYDRDARYAGESKYGPRKLLRLALDGITSFSTVPIKLVAWLGFVCVVFCLIVLAWALYTRFFTDAAPQGWTSLAEAYQVSVDYLREQREVGVGRVRSAAEFVSTKTSEGFQTLQHRFAKVMTTKSQVA